MTVRIIALTGPKYSGKDTAANYIITRKHGTRLAFAERIREVLSIIYDIPLDVLNDIGTKDLGHPNLPDDMTLRDARTFFGEECKRFDPLIWVNPVIRQIRSLRAQFADSVGDYFIVISDVRFPVEIKALTEVGAEFYYVYKPTAEVQMLSSVKAGTCHISERYNIGFKAAYPNFANIHDCSSPSYEQEAVKTFNLGVSHERT